MAIVKDDDPVMTAAEADSTSGGNDEVKRGRLRRKYVGGEIEKGRKAQVAAL